MKDLLHIASLLDDFGQFHLSDKLMKVAQQVQGNFGQLTITEQNRKLEELNYAMRQNTQKIKDLMASYKNGSIRFDQFKQMGQNLNQQANALMAEYKRIEQQSNNFTLQAQNQQQNENLISNSPEEFAKKLIDFKEENNLSSLVQAFDMYARSGAMYGNNPLSRDPRLQKLYQRILQTPRFINEIEIVRELRRIIMGDE
jgi:chromosome segregation ATPase